MSARRPWAEVLDARIDERRIQHVWRGVESRVRAARAPGLDRRFVVGASVVVIAVVMLVSALRPTAAAPFLALADGSAPTARTAHEAETITFADGSRIALDAGAEVVPTRNDRHEIALALTRGAVGVRITPGGPRRWRFDCGLATVEVIGTVFRLDRSDAGVRVSVERGHVRVDAHDGRTWDLLAGDDAWIAAPVAPVARVETETETETESAVPMEPVAEDAVAPRRTATDVPRADEALGESSADDELRVASPRELLLLADVARLSGHPAEAVAPLERLVSLHADAPEAPLAAVVLGRVEQDALHSPGAAARAFEQAEALGVPASLAADVRGRLALAYLELGDPRGPELARRSLSEDPDGPHASALAAHLD